MATFSNEEYAYIVFMYGKADGIGSLARRLYREQYPNRRLPNARVFQNTFSRLSEPGIHHAEPGVNPGRHDTGIEEDIIADPTATIRVVAENQSIIKINHFDMEGVE